MSSLRDAMAKKRGEVESCLADSSIIGLALVGRDQRILDCNDGFRRLVNGAVKPLGEPLARYLVTEDADLDCQGELKLPCRPESGAVGVLQCKAVKCEEGHLLLCERLVIVESRAIETMGIINNDLLNLQRELVKKNLLLERLKSELDQRVDELQAALGRVKQLEGIIPICSYCKKIQKDDKSWQQLEVYLTEHTDALLSHGMCPTCYDEQMSELKRLFGQ